MRFFLQVRRRTALAILLVLGSIILAACSTQGQRANFGEVPAGAAFAEGEEIYFTHTEASDPDIANMLTDMMDSPVIHVPSLANVSDDATADVYVFENGISGDGPLGFQPDVFNHPPGSDEYSPLRQIILVNWAGGVEARTLMSEAEVLEAEANGELTTNPTGIIVNMPFLVWDGGER